MHAGVAKQDRVIPAEQAGELVAQQDGLFSDIEIVTPEETAFSADVSSLQVPAWEGYLGVLAGDHMKTASDALAVRRERAEQRLDPLRERRARNDSLLDQVQHKDDLVHLLKFSQGYYTIEQWGDTLVWNDLRFGQQIGWKNRDARFAFYYFLQYPDDNKLIVQRGRFAGWNKEVVGYLWRRMLGKK